MPYCVKCGVELSPGETACPLCLTPVIIPGDAAPAGEASYPEKTETVAPRIDRRYGARLGTILLMIPMAAVLICDFAIHLAVTWSAYVLGAGVCLFCWVILPIYSPGRKPYVYLTVDFLAAAGYLALIAWRTDGLTWYLSLAMPLILLAGLTLLLCVYAARRIQSPLLNRFSNMFLIAALSLIGAESLIDRFAFGAIRLDWSLYALISMAALAVTIRVVEKNQRLKEVIRRRLFL